jgi:hypothetical protein
MTKDFQDFIKDLEETRFDRKDLQRIYEDRIQNQNSNKYSEYQRQFQAAWDDWAKQNDPNARDVSGFFVKKGDEILRNWFREFFPFYSDKERLILGFKAGGTPEDIIIHMFYRFTLSELTSIEHSLKNITRNLSVRIALTRIFLESFLALEPLISKTVGYQYSLMVEESKFLTKKRGRILFLEIVARPHE